MKVFLVAVFTCALFMNAGTAQADRIQLPDDPDISLGFGSSAFFGTSSKADFQRIQPIFFRFEYRLFKRPQRKWFNRLNFYCSLTPEFARVSYKGKLEDETLVDNNGDEFTVQEDGLERVDLKANMNASGGCGLRQSIYDSKRIHLDFFGEFATSFRKISTTPEAIIVSYAGLSLDVSKTIRDRADLTLSWRMYHAGLTLGYPIDKWKGNKSLRLTPFLIAGYIRFRADINIDIDQELLDDLKRFGIDEDLIPRRERIELNNFTGSVGARLDIGKQHALEAAGAFFFTPKGTRVYWATLSYAMRFDTPW